MCVCVHVYSNRIMPLQIHLSVKERVCPSIPAIGRWSVSVAWRLWLITLSDYARFYLRSLSLMNTCNEWLYLILFFSIPHCWAWLGYTVNTYMCTSLYVVYKWIVWSKTFSFSITSCKALWVHLCLYVGLDFSLHLEEQTSLKAEGKVETQTWPLL